MITSLMSDPTTLPLPLAVHPDWSWEAVLRRDPARDATFVFAVRTTGIFCRPSCAARRPKRENVEFFADPSAARLAGYRPCRRCHPDSQVSWTPDPVETARNLVEADPTMATLGHLAKKVGLSPSHLQRRFKARYGLSPREFASAERAARLRAALRSTGSVSRATYDAGYNSSSRVYASARATLGMTPADYAKGGQGQVIRYTIVTSQFGPLLAAVTDRGVCAVLLGSSDRALSRSLVEEFPRASLERVDAGVDTYLQGIVDRIAGQIAGRATPGEPLPLDLVGTEFQVRVWKALLTIPRGETRSYAAVARAIGRPRSVRAVASAISANRLAVLVPCHRVIREDGSFGGYRWGLPLKRRLVDAERASRN